MSSAPQSPRATVREGIELAYELYPRVPGTLVRGRLVLIMGIGGQLVHWDPRFMEALNRVGFDVLIFDNREVGQSTRLLDAPVPVFSRVLARGLARLPVGPRQGLAYRLEDMADDVAGLMDALNWPRAHIVGFSLGGMIAQHFALQHPARALSLASMMSSTGQRRGMIPTPGALRALLAPAPKNVEQAEKNSVAFAHVVKGSKYGLQEDRIREQARLAFARGSYPPGFLRHFAAMVASGSRAELLPSLRLPTLVLHGTEDPLIPPFSGVLTARQIPDARLELVEGMGHRLDGELYDRVAASIASNVDRSREARFLESFRAAGVPRGSGASR